MTPPDAPAAASTKLYTLALVFATLSLLCIPFNVALTTSTGITHTDGGKYYIAAIGVALVQFVAGVISAIAALVHNARMRGKPGSMKVKILALVAILSGLGGGVVVAFAVLFLFLLTRK